MDFDTGTLNCLKIDSISEIYKGLGHTRHDIRTFKHTNTFLKISIQFFNIDNMMKENSAISSGTLVLKMFIATSLNKIHYVNLLCNKNSHYKNE